MTDLTAAQEALGRHILRCAQESGIDYNSVPDEVEVHYDDWTIEEFDECADGAVEVHARQDGYETTLSRRARYNPPGKAHPAEYEQHDGEVHIHVHADFTEYPLAGEIEAEMMFEGGKPLPPDPDPHEV
jgi:hypothetical protein